MQKLMAAAKRTNERRRLQSLKQSHATQPARRLSLFDRLYAWINNLGILGSTLALMGFVGAFFAIDAAMSERKSIAAFAETLIAWVIGLAVLLCPMFLAVWVGEKVAARTTLKTLVFIAGLVLWWAVTAALYFGAMHIPGIGWRLERIF